MSRALVLLLAASPLTASRDAWAVLLRARQAAPVRAGVASQAASLSPARASVPTMTLALPVPAPGLEAARVPATESAVEPAVPGERSWKALSRSLGEQLKRGGPQAVARMAPGAARAYAGKLASIIAGEPGPEPASADVDGVHDAIARVQAGHSDEAAFGKGGVYTRRVYQLKRYPGIFVKEAFAAGPIWREDRRNLKRLEARLGSSQILVEGVALARINGPFAPYAYEDEKTLLSQTLNTRDVTHAHVKQVRAELNALGLVWTDPTKSNVALIREGETLRPVLIDFGFIFDLTRFRLGWLVGVLAFIRDYLLLDIPYLLLQQAHPWGQVLMRLPRVLSSRRSAPNAPPSAELSARAPVDWNYLLLPPWAARLFDARRPGPER